MALPPPDNSRPLALGWAAFLACSWTWCIGMYLPVLLVRDFGAAGWLVFAVPNVVGAAGLAWVIQRPRTAADLARGHWPAAAAFSVVTILFHAFFVGWVVRSLVGDAAEVLTAALAAGFYFFGSRGRRDLPAAAAVLAISLIAFSVAAFLPDAPRAPGPTDAAPAAGLIWLAPVCAFGFLLCPYLDLTFLRARASTTTGAGIAAFTLGFGVLFVAMILFTLWYARLLQPGQLGLAPRGLAWLVGTHMMVQSAFTVSLHARAISEDRRAKSPAVRAGIALALVGALLIGVWGARVTPAGRAPGETVYRLFMGFYGLLFPAYVWLCMIPTRAAGASVPRRNRIVLAAAVLLAAPPFWLGFVDGRMLWLVPGLAIVLLARAALGIAGRGNVPAPAVVVTSGRGATRS